MTQFFEHYHRLQIEKENAISLLFQGLGIDIKTIHPQYMKFLLSIN